jgi:hypothetical protein
MGIRKEQKLAISIGPPHIQHIFTAVGLMKGQSPRVMLHQVEMLG